MNNRLMFMSSLFVLFATTAVSAQGAKHEAAKPASLEQSAKQGAKMMEGMKTTGEVDRDFMTMMKMHHQQAIDMANIELQKGTNGDAKAMARKIVDAQTSEIEEIDTWLKSHPAKEAKRQTTDAPPASHH